MVSEPTLLGLKSMASANKMRRLKYSCEEVYERMDNGLCIFCDELDTPGHHDLKHKGIQIFIGDDDLACNDVEEVHQIHQAVKNPDPFEEPVKNPDALIEPLDCSSVLQVLASVPDVLMVDRVDSHVKEVEESSQQSTNGNDKIVAHQLFDQMPQRKAEEEKQQTEALRSELNRMLAELKTMTANREATMSKFLSQASIPPRPPFPPPDPPDMCRFGLVKGFVKECEDASMSGDEASHETNSVLEKETIPFSALCQRVPVTLSQNNNVTQQEELNYDMETIVENGLVQEHESLGLTDSVLKVDCVHSQEFSSQFQVPIPSLEPSRRHHKESLVVVNDLSYDHGCVIGKTIESICDSELGQDNSLDEEEFKGLKLGKLSKNERRLSAVCLLEKKEVTKIISAWNNRVWEPGGVLIERDKWKWSGKCHELSIVVWLMQGLSSTRWSYGKVAVLRQELQQPKTNLKEIKLKELDRLTACSSVGTETWLVKCSCEYKIQKLLLCYHSLKVQEKQLFPEDNVEFPEVSIISMRKGLVCDKEKERLRNVKAAGCICDLDQVNSLDEEEFMGFTEFSKPQLAMEFLLLNSGLFMNTRLLHDKINSVFVALALLVVSEHNKAIRTCYEKAEKVDKHKINFTVAVIDEHEDIETACVLLKMSLNGSAHTLSHLVKDNDDGRRNTWFKLTLYSVSQQTTSSTPQSNEVQRETNWNDVTQTEAAWGAKHTSLGYVENSLAEFCAYEVYHHPRPPELSRYKEDEESTATESVSAIVGDNEAKVQKFSSLRTRMFSSREYCDRVYLNHLSISISN